MINGVCPACGFDFNKPATRKRKCPKCKEQLFVTYLPWEDKEAKRYVLEDEYKSNSILWDNRNFFLKCLRVIHWHYTIGGDNEKFEKTVKRELEKHLKREDLYQYTVYLLQQAYIDETGDKYRKICIAEQLNKVREKTGEALIDVQAMRYEYYLQRNKDDLNNYRSLGFKSVVLMTSEGIGCIHPELNGKNIALNDPVIESYLPCKGCCKIVCQFVIIDHDL